MNAMNKISLGPSKAQQDRAHARLMKRKEKKPKPYKMRRYGILNPYGDVWTPDTFNTMAGAHEHIKSFWRNQPDKDISKFEVVLVEVTVRAVG